MARVRRAGASGALTLRADAGFFSYSLLDTLNRLGVSWSITVIINPRIRTCIEAIDESAWQTIFYPDGGEAQVAETTYVTGKYDSFRSLRLVVRRTRLGDPAQQALWPDWRHHAFVTNLDTDTIAVDQFHCDQKPSDLVGRAGLDPATLGLMCQLSWPYCPWSSKEAAQVGLEFQDVHKVVAAPRI